MSATILAGQPVAEEIQQRVAADVAELGARGVVPNLTAVQVGDSPASRLYTQMQQRSCGQAGISYSLLNLPADISQADLHAQIERLNADKAVSGIILQMPLPDHLDARAAQVAIAPRKDAESVHPMNIGRLFFGGEWFVAPCTPAAAVALLRQGCPDLAGKEAVVIGHSEIVGKPIAAMLLDSRHQAPTVTVCHVATRDLAAHTGRAEVLIVAAGVSQHRWLAYREATKRGEKPAPPDLSPLVSGEMIRPGAVVIDVAINRVPAGFDAQGQPLRREDGKLDMVTVGDVDFEAAKELAAAITPVPGGVGPVTVAMLLQNVVACAKAQ
jgi:methylenetetrahydrofolate dehydrogenase (NADP+)/methenyltetrahydrofolate cyclohydrolase